jgi:hypothetical protein
MGSRSNEIVGTFGISDCPFIVACERIAGRFPVSRPGNGVHRVSARLCGALSLVPGETGFGARIGG